MKAWPKRTIRNHILVAIALMTILFAAGFQTGSIDFITLSFFTTGAYFYISTKKFFKRKKVTAAPFPLEWRLQLEKCVPYYKRLDPDAKERFETDIQIFLSEQHISGLRGMDVSDEIKVMIAASAAILGHGLPDWDWPNLRDILVYPTAFDESYDIAESNPIAGIVHQQGPIIFSERDLKHGFCKPGSQRPGGGIHVGLHELAHVLDMSSGAADGIPANMTWMATAPWIKIMVDRMQKINSGEAKRVLRPYAGVNPAEFFAVAVEAFFEKPAELRTQDPALYAMLADYFKQDPANF